MNVFEVMQNLGKLCKDSKLTWDEHQYFDKGLMEIFTQLQELQALKSPKDEAPKEEESK